jgi:hypothetical protein
MIDELESRISDLLAMIRGYLGTTDELDTTELHQMTGLLKDYDHAINNILLDGDLELATDLLACSTLDHLTND